MKGTMHALAGAQGLEESLLYDWNLAAEMPARPAAAKVLDETLRDGLQSPSALQPPVEKKIELLHLMDGLGIDRAVISYPGAGPRALSDTIAMANAVARDGLRIGLDCAGRTAAADILPIAEAQERSGVALTACVFIGSSAIRQFVEGWDLDFLLRTAHEGTRSRPPPLEGRRKLTPALAARPAPPVA